MLLLAGDTQEFTGATPRGAWFSWRDHRVDKVLKKAMRQPGRLCVRGSQNVRRFPEKTRHGVIEGYKARQK